MNKIDNITKNKTKSKIRRDWPKYKHTNINFHSNEKIQLDPPSLKVTQAGIKDTKKIELNKLIT